MAISFFSEDIKFTLKHKLAVKNWIKATAAAEGKKAKEINYIFCSDDYLLNINQTYLDHDTFTDIVTFDNSEKEGEIISDIFISVDRTRENAKMFNVPEVDELHRVMIHGVLHLCGFKDKTEPQKKLMREKEDFYLSAR